MLIVGMLIALFILLLSSSIFGPYGIMFGGILLFGLVFSTHYRTKRIYEDLKLIREHLGLIRDDEKAKLEEKMMQEEVKQLEKDPSSMSKVNKEIEEELERHIAENKDDKNNKDDK